MPESSCQGSVYPASQHRAMRKIVSIGLSKPTVNGSDTLGHVLYFVKRFVSISKPEAVAVALWIAHTHALDAAETTPYLNISSAEKQCGKTRLLEVLSLLVARPWFTGSGSRAVLVRKIELEQPTLLLDESDAAFGGDKEYAEALRGVLNSGHNRNGVVSLCVGMGANIAPKDFCVFCPKAIAGIGKLPDTVADRSIPIRMKRRGPNERVERFRKRLHQSEAAAIRDQFIGWLTPALRTLKNAQPQLPDVLSDRQQDGCEPLLAIADLAAGEWPERARAALVEIFGGEAAEDASIGVRLLADIQTVFSQQNVERIFTVDLLGALCDLDPQWLEFSYGKPLSAASLARLLKSYAVFRRKIRIGERTASGYLRESFADSWTRYVPRKPEHVEQSSNDAGEMQFLGPEPDASVPWQECEESSINMRPVPCVPLFSDEEGQTARFCYTCRRDTERWESPAGSGNWLCVKCHPNVSISSQPRAPLKPHVPTACELGFSAESQLCSPGK